MHECTCRRLGICRAHQRLADQRGVQSHGAPPDESPRLDHTRLAHHEAIVGNEAPQPQAVVGIHRQRSKVAVVQSDQARAGRESGLELAFIVSLHERLEAEFEGQVHEPGQLLGREHRGQQQNQVRPAGTKHGKLPLIDDELFGEYRQPDGGPHGSNVGH